MFGSTQCNWNCAFVYNSKKNKPISQAKNDFSRKHICVVKEDTCTSYADMERIARDSFFNRGGGVPASTVVITNVAGFLEMDSWVAGNATPGLVAIPVLNGAIFSYSALGLITSSNKREILVTIKKDVTGKKVVDHLETTGEAAKPDHKKFFTDYKDEEANDIPWWLFGS